MLELISLFAPGKSVSTSFLPDRLYQIEPPCLPPPVTEKSTSHIDAVKISENGFLWC